MPDGFKLGALFFISLRYAHPNNMDVYIERKMLNHLAIRHLQLNLVTKNKNKNKN